MDKRQRPIWPKFLYQQGVHALHIRGGVLRQAALGQQGLVKQDVGQVVEVHAAVQLLHQRVLGVHLQHGFGFGRLLASLLEHAGELRAHAVVLHHQACG